MRHASAEFHTNVFPALQGLVALGGRGIQYDMRASLYCKGLDPIIEFKLPPGAEVLPNGIIRVPNSREIHLEWVVTNFSISPFESLNPNTEYLNGKQHVSPDGIITGHAHLHLVPLRLWHQVCLASSGKPGVEMPPEHDFDGGHDWYRSIKIDDKTCRIMAVKKNKLPLTETYLMLFQLVHEDDQYVTPTKHGLVTGHLMTIIEAVETS